MLAGSASVALRLFVPSLKKRGLRRQAPPPAVTSSA